MELSLNELRPHTTRLNYISVLLVPSALMVNISAHKIATNVADSFETSALNIVGLSLQFVAS